MPAPTPKPLPHPPPPSVDGVTTAKAPAAPIRPPPPPDPKTVAQEKRLLLGFLGLLYAAYAVWCFALMSLLPTTDVSLVPLKDIGVLSAAVGAVVFALLGAMLLPRILRSDVAPAARQKALLRIVLVVVPGLFLSAAVPFAILRSPSLPLEITPDNAEELVAPLAITISAEKATALLQSMGKRVIQYAWYTNGTAKPTETTVSPTTTVKIPRTGVYAVSVDMKLADGAVSRATRRIIVSQELFSVDPYEPVVEQPAQFSLESLLSDPKDLVSAEWDFEGDGKATEKTTATHVTHTFYTKGKVEVTVVVDLKNQTQRTYRRIVNVVEPPPLPFPITLKSDPKKLIGPSPLGVMFTAETREPIANYYWSYGDGKQEEGPDLLRVSHVYEKPGTFSVLMRARSASGRVAEITSVALVTEALTLSDLQFEGNPPVQGGAVEGEVPLSVKLTPKTAQPLIQFSWEYPENVEGHVTNATFEAVFHHEGTYQITLIAQEPGGSSARIPLAIRVRPPAAEPTINVRPEGGTAPLHVVLDASDSFIPPGETVAGFKWLFGDETNGTGGETGGSQVEHTYRNSGEYKVLLTVIMASGKEYTAQRTIVVRKPLISACATPSRLTVTVGGAVQFDSACTAGNVTSYLWDVRQADRPNVIIAQSAQPTYVHVFDQQGTFTVMLTVEDGNGNSDTQSLTITVTPP